MHFVFTYERDGFLRLPASRSLYIDCSAGFLQRTRSGWTRNRYTRCDATRLAQLLQMLQQLLADRFKLKSHRETREASGYVLLVAKNGSKLEEATGNGQTRISGGRPGGGVMAAQNVSISEIATFLSIGLDGPVVDKTGLTGKYSLTLRWAPGDNKTPDDPTAPSLFTALQEQLGLRLESQKLSTDVIVIDYAERPAPN